MAAEGGWSAGGVLEWILGGAAVVFWWAYRQITGDVKDLQKESSKQGERISVLEKNLELSGRQILEAIHRQSEEHRALAQRMEDKVDGINAKFQRYDENIASFWREQREHGDHLKGGSP